MPYDTPFEFPDPQSEGPPDWSLPCPRKTGDPNHAFCPSCKGTGYLMPDEYMKYQELTARLLAAAAAFDETRTI